MANVQILDAAMSVDRYSGMGTTIVVTLVSNGRLSVAHVGDSRLYLFGPRLRQLTCDDSWTVSGARSRVIVDRALLQNHPMRTCADERGRCGRAHRRARHRGGAYAEDARLVLTTDGVHGVLDDGRVEQLLVEGDDSGRVPEPGGGGTRPRQPRQLHGCGRGVSFP